MSIIFHITSVKCIKYKKTLNDSSTDPETVLQWSPLIRTVLLPSNSVLTREVSFGEREHYIYS